MTAFTATGCWRVYFNKHGAAGLPWCIAPEGGGWELAVRFVDLMASRATAIYEPKATPDDEDGRPSAWFKVAGQLTVTASGLATITG